MGGSSLCAEVVRRTFGKRDGYPELLVLDSTVPEAVAMLEAQIDVARTLFIVASKSGTTTEPMMFHRYFYDRVKQVKGDRAGENFVAITDPDTQLVQDAQRDEFRMTFATCADIGGRYSALSLFGLVPMALTGVDIVTLLDRAVHTVHLSHDPAGAQESGALLGTVLGATGAAGPRQADAHHAAPARHARPLGRAAHRREHGQGRQGHRAGRGRAAARAE